MSRDRASMTVLGRQSTNEFEREIEATLPRVLALADRDPLSPTLGVGDRQYWAWKLIDFPNATFQGVVNGLASLLSSGLLAAEVKTAIAGRIEELVEGTRRIVRRDGSLEEAFPYERSYCVTALIAYDLLHARDDLAGGPFQSSAAQIMDVTAPLVGFLVRADETHGLISNHLATAVAALLRWHKHTGDPLAKRKAEFLLERILSHQSAEGWFSEYGGADPGYQSLCLTYLADAAACDPNPRLNAALMQSVRFLWHFAHPDGSFGGIYGSRSTRIYYPAGVEALSAVSPEAAALARFMRSAIAAHRTVPLVAIDQPNLAPMFNNYCWAARLVAARSAHQPDDAPAAVLPALGTASFRRHFDQAGLLIDGGERHYTIVSTHKGGLVYHFTKTTNATAQINTGAVAQDARGRHFTSQTYDPGNTFGIDETGTVLTVESSMRLLQMPLPGPWRFLVLRALNVTLMRIPMLSEIVKRALVRLLISGKRPSMGRNTRTIKLGADLDIDDVVESPMLRMRRVLRPFSVIHMASQGYWQLGDDIGTDERAASAAEPGPR